MTTPRIDAFAVAPDLMKLMVGFSTKVAEAGLEHSLVELVKIRASQINGCAICLQMHAAEARRHGETEERIYMLDAWHEASLYSERERAALAWTDALTRLEGRAPDDVYAQVQAQFTPEEQVKLSMMIAVINSWNRLGVGLRLPHAVSKPRVAA